VLREITYALTYAYIMIVATLLILVLGLYMIKLVLPLNMSENLINASLIFCGGYDNLRPTIFFVALTFE
jgi:hypothetical protein